MAQPRSNCKTPDTAETQGSMKRKTPEFWYPQLGNDDASNSVMPTLLCPLEALYKIAFKLHQSMSVMEKAAIPVLCVGNLVAGGTGKTPSSIAFLKFLIESGFAKNPYFLIRGYGGAERGPVLVNPDSHTAWDVGDESLILARHAPTVVSADRIDGAALAHRNGADLVIMDDGLQNPGIHKDLKIIVINGEMGFGNGHMMPAGPMREPLEQGLRKADAFLLIGKDKTNAAATLPDGIPVLKAHLEAKPENIPDMNKKYLAFAGLGYPEKFFGFLKNDIGLDVVREVRFADHCPYEEEDLAALAKQAKDIGADLITTQKDYLRLPTIKGVHVHALPIHMVWDTPGILKTLLKKTLG